MSPNYAKKQKYVLKIGKKNTRCKGVHWKACFVAAIFTQTYPNLNILASCFSAPNVPTSENLQEFHCPLREQKGLISRDGLINRELTTNECDHCLMAKPRETT
jgi:hypothetical protein